MDQKITGAERARKKIFPKDQHIRVIPVSESDVVTSGKTKESAGAGVG